MRVLQEPAAVELTRKRPRTKFYKAHTPYTYDLAKAKELMAASRTPRRSAGARQLHGEPVAWPVQQVVVHLGPVIPAERSESVRLRVSRGDKGLSWLQRAPAEPPFGEDRDRAAFVRFLGARGFLLWVAGLLADDGRQGEGDWTKARSV
jgi:hypothetical protein